MRIGIVPFQTPGGGGVLDEVDAILATCGIGDGSRDGIGVVRASQTDGFSAVRHGCAGDIAEDQRCRGRAEGRRRRVSVAADEVVDCQRIAVAARDRDGRAIARPHGVHADCLVADGSGLGIETIDVDDAAGARRLYAVGAEHEICVIVVAKLHQGVAHGVVGALQGVRVNDPQRARREVKGLGVVRGRPFQNHGPRGVDADRAATGRYQRAGDADPAEGVGPGEGDAESVGILDAAFNGQRSRVVDIDRRRAGRGQLDVRAEGQVVVAGIVEQDVGPRIVAGDANQAIEDRPALARERARGIGVDGHILSDAVLEPDAQNGRGRRKHGLDGEGGVEGGAVRRRRGSARPVVRIVPVGVRGAGPRRNGGVCQNRQCEAGEKAGGCRKRRQPCQVDCIFHFDSFLAKPRKGLLARG